MKRTTRTTRTTRGRDGSPRSWFSCLGGVCLLVAVACGGGSDGGAPDIATDVAGDGGGTRDTAATDAVGPDAAPDVRPDVRPDVPPDVPLDPPALWPERDPVQLDGPFYERHPELGPWSRWRMHLDHRSRTPSTLYWRERGAFALGNGLVFGMTGLARPASTIHGMAGPTYEKGEGFFGDLALGLSGPGEAAWDDFEEEWVLTSLGAPVLVWRGRRGQLEIDAVDLVPWAPDDIPADSVLRRTWLRTILVRNNGSDPVSGLTLEVRSNRGAPRGEDGMLFELRDDRWLATFFDRNGAVAEGSRLSLALPEIAAGGEERLFLAHVAGGPRDSPEQGRNLIRTQSTDHLIEQSAETMAAWWSGLTALTTPDPVVNDLVRNLALGLRVQLSSGGATTQMSQYTGTWTRDNVGPLLGLLAIGAHDDAARLLTYYWRAVLDAGGLRNRYPADLDLSGPPPAEPDWASLPRGTGRTAGEAPSYLPLMYGRYAAWTGDIELAAAHMGMLRYALDSQQLSPEGLLPWSGDETFRAAMNAAMGLELEYPHHDVTWSPNSSLLFVAGARALAGLAAALDDEALATELAASAERVEQAALAHLRLDDGCWAAYVFREDATPSPGPFEDAALKEIWAGARPGDDPEAAARLACLLKRAGAGPGIIQSPLHPRYLNFPLFPFVEEGVFTGMLPGYTLAALTRAGHPEAEAAFNELRRAVDLAGLPAEYMVFDDHLPLQIIYNPEGSALVDYTARYRSWEGGIILDALMGYLVGPTPGDPGTDALELRPHLPNHWPGWSARGLRFAGAWLDVTLTRLSREELELRVGSRADRPFSLRVRWDHRAAVTPAITADGVPVDESALVRRAHFGAASVELGPRDLPAGGELVLRFAE